MFHGLIDEIIFQFQDVFRCKYVLERDRFGGVCSGVCIKETVSASFSLHTVSFHCQIKAYHRVNKAVQAMAQFGLTVVFFFFLPSRN